MDEVLSSLDFAFCYLDDILIGSSTPDEHLLHLHLVLQQYRLVLNMEKLGGQASTFGPSHHSRRSLSHNQAEVIQNFPRLLDKKQLQSFLGLVNFYRRFILAAAQILLPLEDAL
jgi:hypothetical protein